MLINWMRAARAAWPAHGAILAAASLAALGLAACGGGSGSAGMPGALAIPPVANAAPNAPSSSSGKTSEALQAPAPPSPAMQIVDGSRDQTRPPSAARDRVNADGTYRVYATNGSQLTLVLNMAEQRYTMTEADGTAATGSFTEDTAEPGSYIFQSPRITAATNTARFRIVGDAVVGAFPLSKANVSPPAFAVQPFVAAHTFVSDPAQLDGMYGRFGISHSGGTSDSLVQEMLIHSGGTMLRLCAATFGLISNCPSNLLTDHPLTMGADGTLVAAGSSNPAEAMAFRVARIAGQNVYLAAGAPPGTSGQKVMKIGLASPSNGWGFSARGFSTDGAYGPMARGLVTYSTRLQRPDGSAGGFAYWGSSISGSAVLYMLNGRGSDRYMVGNSNGLAVLSTLPGAWGTGAKGFLQIGVLYTPKSLDPRNGLYRVFATNGWRHTLALDFDHQTYGISDEAFHSTGGTFAADTAEPGSFIFNSARISTPLNTARFRPLGDGANAIVGAFPLAVGPLASTTFAVQPFFATMGRAVTQDLPGTYNRSAMTIQGSDRTLRHQQLRILPGASTMVACDDPALRSIDDCPAASIATYSVSPETPGSMRRYVNLANAADTGEFMIASFMYINAATGLYENQKVFVSAGDPTTAGASPGFAIGLQDSTAWRAVTGYGSSNSGAQAPWNSIALDATRYTRQSMLADGSQTSTMLSVDAAASGAPGNVRGIGGGGFSGIVMQHKKLSVLAGKAGTVDGLIELSTID